MKTQTIKVFLSDLSKRIDPLIIDILNKSVEQKYRPIITYQISSGGKRLRPALAVLCCNIFGGGMSEVLYPAAVLEILHNYTLILDDIIDHSSLRRNKETTWKKYGKSIAECISMDYAASIFDLPRKVKHKEQLYPLLTKTIKEITSGQFYDILFEQYGRDDENYIKKNRYRNVSVSQYLKMVGKKTATLLQTSCLVGGMYAGASKKQIKDLSLMGFNLGIAFQIQDDILDMFGDEKSFGKSIGKDIEERKLGNVVLLIAFKELKLRDKNKIKQVLQGTKIKKSDIKEVLRLINKTNARKNAEKLAQQYIKRVYIVLQKLPKNKYRGLLIDLVDNLVNRQK